MIDHTCTPRLGFQGLRRLKEMIRGERWQWEIYPCCGLPLGNSPSFVAVCYELHDICQLLHIQPTSMQILHSPQHLATPFFFLVSIRKETHFVTNFFKNFLMEEGNYEKGLHCDMRRKEMVAKCIGPPSEHFCIFGLPRLDSLQFQHDLCSFIDKNGLLLRPCGGRGGGDIC